MKKGKDLKPGDIFYQAYIDHYVDTDEQPPQTVAELLECVEKSMVIDGGYAVDSGVGLVNHTGKIIEAAPARKIDQQADYPETPEEAIREAEAEERAWYEMHARLAGAMARLIKEMTT